MVTKSKEIVIRYNRAYNEYRVPGKKGTEASAYYTDDKEDAIRTARAEHGRNISIKVKRM